MMKALESIKQGHENIRKLYLTILIMGITIGIQAIFNVYLISVCANIEPVLIRVSEAGKAEAISLDTSSSPASNVEIKYLTKEIAETLFGFSRITFEEDLKRMMPYVSYALKSELLQQYRKVASIYLNQSKELRIEVFAVLILSSQKNKVLVRVDYIKRDTLTEEGRKFYSILTFKRVKRSIHNPFGLELIQVQEHKYLKE